MGIVSLDADRSANKIAAGIAITGGPVPTDIKVSPVKYAKISVAGTGNENVISGVAGKKIRVLDYIVASPNNAVLTWKSSGGTELSGQMHVAANGNLVAVGGYQTPAGMFGLFETLPGEGLLLNADKPCGGHLTYQEISV